MSNNENQLDPLSVYIYVDQKRIDDIKILKQEIMKLAELTFWQPIETAPKNGTWILISLYYNNYPNEKQTAITFWMDDITGWVWFGNNYKEKITLTHWMPLPNPPTN